MTENKQQWEMDPRLVEILVCPKDHTPLRQADAELVDRVNQALAAGTLRNRLGRTLDKPLDGGLVREDGAVLYPVLDGIPVLLTDEAIDLEQLG